MCIRAGAVAQAALIRKVRGKHGNVSFVDIRKTRVPEKERHFGNADNPDSEILVFLGIFYLFFNMLRWP